jgi:flagellar hook-associated protein 2
MGIGVSGLMSGLDTESIVTQLMQMERRPILQLQRQEAGIQAKISGLGSVKGGLSGLQRAVKAMQNPAAILPLKALSGNADVLTASASTAAVAGKYQVEVTALAQAQQVRSFEFEGSDAVVGTGTLAIRVGGEDEPSVTITIDEDHRTLAGIAEAINDAEAGVTAGVVNAGDGKFYLTLTSDRTGDANTITLTMADADGDNTDTAGLSRLYTTPAVQELTQTQAASDAALSLNGIAVTRAENTITDLIEGVTITLKTADPGPENVFTLTVSRDTATVASKLNDFVSQYNVLVDTLKGLQAYDPETGKGGLLQGDSITRQVEARLRAFLRQPIGEAGDAVRSLSDLGVQVERNGQLSLDQDILSAALEEDRDSVVNFLTGENGDGEGFAGQLDALLDQYLNGSTGLLATKETGLKSSIAKIGDQIERVELRLSKREETLRRRFDVMETLMAEFQTTSGALDQQLQSLSNLNTSIARGRK